MPRGCLSGGVCMGRGKGVCLGGVCLGGVYLGCVCPKGCLPGEGGVCLGMSAWGGVCPGGVFLGESAPPPAVDRMTEACEIIAFPQLLLLTVKIETISQS